MGYSFIYRGYDVAATDRGFEVSSKTTKGTYLCLTSDEAMNLIDGFHKQQRMAEAAREKETKT